MSVHGHPVAIKGRIRESTDAVNGQAYTTDGYASTKARRSQGLRKLHMPIFIKELS